jgi:hypothetical protein
LTVRPTNGTLALVESVATHIQIQIRLLDKVKCPVLSRHPAEWTGIKLGLTTLLSQLFLLGYPFYLRLSDLDTERSNSPDMCKQDAMKIWTRTRR